MAGLRAAALMVGLALPLATAGGAAAQEAAEASAITALYTGVLNGVGKGTGQQSAGWAMSAIGLSGGESGQLAAINAQLQQIDADLQNINNTLNEILQATQAQTCIETQISDSLVEAVNHITLRYNQYQTFVSDAAVGVPPTQDTVVQWQQAVVDTNSGIAADLNALHNGVYSTANANVISTCAVAFADSFLGAAKDATTFFDDRPSYAQLVNLVNYYYGVYVQGATVLVEAYHLQACQAAAQDDPNLHCDFATVSTSTSPLDVATICDAPTSGSDVQRACQAARNVVTNPGTASAMYERVEAWLKYAGAPYATGEAVGDAKRTFVSGELGLLSAIVVDDSTPPQASWSSSYAYLIPKDLLDFTNNVTIDGANVFDCASPLTSTNPCGPIGPYDAQLEPGMSYGGINGHWKAVTADVLLHLFKPYNNGEFGDRSGTLADFMYSIGFSAATKSSALIVTTANTGKNGITDAEAICFMDTSSSRDRSKQPWCDGIKDQVQGTDNLLNFKNSDTCSTAKEHTWTHDLASQPAFYKADWDACSGWSPRPGWLQSEQDSPPGSKQSIFWQYHWPVTNVAEIGCQNGKPYLNPGGLLSRCAGDLQEYVDALLPPPDSNSVALDASGDATLLADEPHRNTGEDQLLAIGSRGTKEFVVHFADERLERFLAGGEMRSAILRLSLADRGSPRRLKIVPLTGPFVEGKGVGTGATWTCAEDADVDDGEGDCLQHWPTSRFAHGVTRKPDQKDMAAGLIGFDVTEDVKAGVTAWLIQSPRPGARHGAYYSREGALAAHEPWRAPTLLLERQHPEAEAALRLSAAGR
jgi:hypothetical protein